MRHLIKFKKSLNFIFKLSLNTTEARIRPEVVIRKINYNIRWEVYSYQ